MKIYQLKSSSLHLYRSFLGRSPRDTEIWQYAKDKKLVIVTKDTDFSDQLMLNFFCTQSSTSPFWQYTKTRISSVFSSYLARS
ncbi:MULTISPECIES: DUF5615 family PIN-like protein [Microcystis]|nr:MULTISPECIES: DUF5615 family PIN-like protein [Microcystis]MCZ8241156.1 DUF5615 family PIN-like protein [Microcystis sp. LE19-131.1A]